MLPNQIPMADVLELQTVDYAQKVLAESIEWAKEQGRFYCDIERSTYDICRKDLEQKGYYIEYNMPFGFRVHWNAEYIKRLKENLELMKAYREEQQHKSLLTMDLKTEATGDKVPEKWYSSFVRSFKRNLS